MSLERNVLINNEVRGYHEVALVESVPNSHLTITVESFASKEAKDKLAERDDPNHIFDANEQYDHLSYEQYMPVDTYYELAWPSDGIVDLSKVEEAVWGLPEFSEYVDSTAEISNRDAIIAEMAAMLTDEQISRISKRASLKTSASQKDLMSTISASKTSMKDTHVSQL